MTAKVYVDVLAVFSREGELIPTAFVWEDGRKYAIDKGFKTGALCQSKCWWNRISLYLSGGRENLSSDL